MGTSFGMEFSEFENVNPNGCCRSTRAKSRHFFAAVLELQGVLALTRRQQQLIPQIAQGLTNKEVANRFCLSDQTVTIYSA
jgi:DNA-binding NarL/FixJ family response regulator